MIFRETKLAGAYVIDLEKIEDERGFFARSWCKKDFLEHGLDPNVVQCNVSFNKTRGTLRGMHYQLPPFAESKLIRCTKGTLYDVIIDLRPDSPTFLRWFGIELSEENRRILYVPKLFAHGFQTMEDNTEVFYQMSEFYSPGHSKGVRWNDPLFNITWPPTYRIISVRDQHYPDATEGQFRSLRVT